MNREELRLRVARELGVNKEDLIWSDQCLNPLTTYHHEDGTIKGELGYWVTTVEAGQKKLDERW